MNTRTANEVSKILTNGTRVLKKATEQKTELGALMGQINALSQMVIDMQILTLHKLDEKRK